MNNANYVPGTVNLDPDGVNAYGYLASPQADGLCFRVPRGWRLVPILATPEMDAAGQKALSDNGVDNVDDTDALVAYHATTSAAPRFTYPTQRSDSDPKWSPDPPIKDGWYWVRGHVRDVSEIGIEIVEVNKGRVSFVNEECSPLLSVTRGCSWYGPLQEPA